jgi:GNAT superfamily N-acetyltransferase
MSTLRQPDSVVVARTAGEYQAFAALIREYWEWLINRYVDHPGLFDKIGSYQGLEDELAAIDGVYGPPEGKALLALRGTQVCGAVGYRDMHDGSCEMKRLFVPARFQGNGTGRRLCESLIATAASDGFALMRLDTGYLNGEAMQMYESMGFVSCVPYREYPAELLPHLRFMERPLVGVQNFGNGAPPGVPPGT